MFDKEMVFAVLSSIGLYLIQGTAAMWALNVLFPSLGIPFTFETVVAAAILTAVL